MNPEKSRDPLEHIIPIEIIVHEILYKLPIPTLIICTSVCKRWLSLIKNSTFITTYSDRRRLLTSQFTDPCSIIVQICFNSFIGYTTEVGKIQERVYFPPSSFFGVPKYKDFEVIGVCNGLVCLYERVSKTVLLWNPAIKKSFTLPRPCHFTYGYSYFGFVFQSRTKDYKVLKIDQFLGPRNSHGLPTDVELYSFNSNSWKAIDSTYASGFSICSFHRGQLPLASEYFHYVSANNMKDQPKESLLVRFDVNNEKFDNLVLPESFQHVHPNSLYVVPFHNGSSISVVHKQGVGSFELWVMRMYGVKESWTKLLRVRDMVCIARVLGFTEDEKVLVQRLYCIERQSDDVPDDEIMVLRSSECGIISIDPMNKCYTFLKTGSLPLNGKSYIYPYAGSLALLDLGTSVSDSDSTNKNVDGQKNKAECV